MATVKSLGLHQPSGLHHAVEEQLLPPNAPASLYTWDISIDHDHGEPVEDELLITDSCVVWCRGRVFRKTFKFHLDKEPITQALLTYFPASEDEGKRRDEADMRYTATSPALEKALVVFLKTQAHIYFLSGTSHVVHMPFEVESACAGPVGVIIQGKPRSENSGPLSLKFPRVPTNSFVSSQLTAFQSSQQTTFSVEGLGNPRSLHMGLSSTLENMLGAPLVRTESRWPRMVSLLDPLQDIGLVVTEPDMPRPRGAKRESPRKSHFLDPGEELLHVEEIHIPRVPHAPSEDSLTLAVTINREKSTYTVWRLAYMEHEDPFVGRRKAAKAKAARRRSSMQPPFTSGASTPIQQDLGDSFGVPLPGKRQRKSEKVEKPLDLVSSLEKEDKEGSGTTRRSSRRLSSMLARADLSASHERSMFAEQTLVPSGSQQSKRHESLGHHQARSSSSYHHQIHPSLGSLLEAPFDMGLDEGFHNMGLDDHDFDGMQHEILLKKVYTISFNSSNVHYSTSDHPAYNQSKVIILKAPPFATESHTNGQLLIGIQDAVEKRLELLMLQLKIQPKFCLPIKTGQKEIPNKSIISVVPGELRSVRNVVDSCKLVDESQSVLLVLSESMDGKHELSTQAPWSELTKISLSLLYVEDPLSLQSRGRAVDRDVEQRKSETIDFTNGSLIGIRHPRRRGLVDVVDTHGRLHQLRIQLQPSCSQVTKVLDVCRSILPDGLGERVHVGWIHIMQWLADQNIDLVNTEWSALVILLLASYLNIGPSEGKVAQPSHLPVRKRRHTSGSFGTIRDTDDWRTLETRETANSLGCPMWMMNQGWQWALDEDTDDAMSPQGDLSFSLKFITRHIRLAKEYMASGPGVHAFGSSGYMPTSGARSAETRTKVAVDTFMALHLLLQEQKLDIMTPEYGSPGRADFRVVLCQIARWLKWHSFAAVYELGIQEEIDNRHDNELALKHAITQPQVQPDIFEWIQDRFVGQPELHYPTLAEIYYANSHLSEAEKSNDDRWNLIVPRTVMFKRFFSCIDANSTPVQIVETMRDCGLTNGVLETLPEAILAPLQDAISLCQPHPPADWDSELLDLVKRSDISLALLPGKRPSPVTTNILMPTHIATWDFRLLCQSVDETNSLGYDEGEGTERQAVIRALFKDDRRLNEAQDLLSTHRARIVQLHPNPSWPESEYLENQKELVTRVATGTLAIPAGRALLFYSLRYPLITQKFHISGFNLNCIVRPGNVTVGVDKSLFTEEKVCWGFFHQGVAAGLAISPNAKGIDTSWILYNKPAQELSNRHAGFLLALGLNGHLKDVAKWVAFKYLTPKHTMTSIGLLLGLAASYIGTMDSLITRLLSVHATRMLPRGAAELNLSPLTQTSGIMGIGLLYCNSQHRRMSEIMLSEIEHIEDEDEEEPLRSECYRLAAGFALGFINLGKGNDLKGLHDMRLTEKLIAHATATKNVEIVHVLDRASAGAVMAIALIFMKSEDQIVARKIDVPDSILQFDYVRPDILLLRTVAKNLILWSSIEPTYSWVEKSLPIAYRSWHLLDGVMRLRSSDLPFYSILTGLCFSIALRFSGSASPKVRDLLLHYLDQFIRISKLKSPQSLHPDGAPLYDEELARTNARMCQDILALSCAIVMAGTGDIPVLRRLRALHGRDDGNTPYGSHLAAHLAVGSLFLGCGTVTFGSSNKAIAALLVAFYPIFPTSVMDNRSHLQAFRHFWVLATEQRCLVAKDVLTSQPVSVSVHIKMKPDTSAEPILYRTTPCLLPPLDQIATLATSCGPQFWDVELDFSDDEVRNAFAETQSLYLRRRPPREGAFSSTLRALGETGRGENPLEWVFELDALQGINYAERAAVLETSEEDQTVGGAVDAKLEMQRGIADGGDRERLEGARLLFEWGGVRDRLLQSGASVHDSQATITAGKTSRRRRAGSEPDSSHPDDATAAAEDVWWMGDSAIEALKGQVWLAARGDQ